MALRDLISRGDVCSIPTPASTLSQDLRQACAKMAQSSIENLMVGTFFDYFVGFLRVEFQHTRFDLLTMVISASGDAVASTPCDDNFKKGEAQIYVKDDVCITTKVSAVFCPFYALMALLEALTVGVQECAFEWDAEGPMGELRWRGSGSNGMLYVSWDSNDKTECIRVKHAVRLSKAQMVRAFYTSFRNFVESDCYQPLRYENLNAGESFALVLDDGNLVALAEALATRERQSAYRLLHALYTFAYDYKIDYPRRSSLDFFIEIAIAGDAIEVDDKEVSRWLPAHWNSWDAEDRRKYIFEEVFRYGLLANDGAKLRELRSPLVEHWLALNPDTVSTGTRPI